MTGTGSDLGDRDFVSPTTGGANPSDPYGVVGSSTVYDTGDEAGGTPSGGGAGSGVFNPEDLGTGHRLEDRDL